MGGRWVGDGWGMGGGMGGWWVGGGVGDGWVMGGGWGGEGDEKGGDGTSRWETRLVIESQRGVGGRRDQEEGHEGRWGEGGMDKVGEWEGRKG